MTPNGLRWTRHCVSTSATALLAVSGSVTAFASRQHTFQHGDTLSSIARTYHVSVSDLEQANHLDRHDNIRDGRRLTIPNPPKRVAVDATMHRSARAKGDRISLRLGPGSDYRRVNFVDDGSSLTVTAAKDGWFQVELDNGRSGWLRQDFVVHGPHAAHENRTVAAHRAGGERRSAHAASDLIAGQAASGAAHEARGALVATRHAEKMAHNARKASHHATQVARSGQSKHAHTAHHGEIARSGQSKHAHTAHHGEIARADERAERGEGRHRRAHDKQSAAHRARAHAAEVAARAHHHNGQYDVAARVHKSAHTVALRHAHKHNVEVARESSSRQDDIVHTAYAYRGTPYVYGGEGRGGFDCSGFTSYLYGRKGVSLPHSARGQFAMGRHVDRSSLKPGDLVFFHTVTPGISHVGMYVGNGRFVHASSRRSGGVRVDNLDSGYYSSAFRGARRMR